MAAERIDLPEIAICIPTLDHWAAQFGFCLANMLTYSQSAMVFKLGGMQLLMERGSPVHSARTKLVKRAIESGQSHVLFLDNDMTFPETLLLRLLAHGTSIIACNYVKRMLPATPVTRDLDGETLSSHDKSGLQSVMSIGLGAALIETQVFRDIPAATWFPLVFNEDTEDYSTEDWGFCSAMHGIGREILIDHDLSKEIGHAGTYVYSHQDIAS